MFYKNGVAVVGDMTKAVYDANDNSRIEKDAMGITLNKLLKGAGTGSNPTEIDVPGGATKEFFIPVIFADDLGQYFDYPRGFINAPDGDAWVIFMVPADFTSLISAELIGFAGAGVGAATMKLTLDSMYFASGEAYNTHNEASADQASEANATDLAFIKWSISGILSALAAGDFVGIKATYSATALATDVYLLGIRVKYS